MRSSRIAKKYRTGQKWFKKCPVLALTVRLVFLGGVGVFDKTVGAANQAAEEAGEEGPGGPVWLPVFLDEPANQQAGNNIDGEVGADATHAAHEADGGVVGFFGWGCD